MPSNPSRPIALGPFLQQLSERFSSTPLEALKERLLTHARHITGPEREAFLQMLAPREATQDTTLLTDIALFIERLRRGDSTSWADEMERLFHRAGEAFVSGDDALSLGAYRALLYALRLEADGELFSAEASEPQEMLSVDLDEAKARYLRALYHTLSPNERARSILDELISLANIGSWRVLLRDIEETLPTPLSAREGFFDAFEHQLRATPREGQNRLYPREDLRRALLREVVQENHGNAGLFTLAHEEGAWHPEVYHLLFARLSAANDPKAALLIARDGMLSIEDPTERTLLAEHAAALARAQGNEAFALVAQVQAFRATPTVARLLPLLSNTKEEDIEAWTTRELEEARHRVLLPESVAAWLSLLRGDIKSVLRHLQSASALGWSRPEHPGKVAFVALLLFGAGSAPSPGSSLAALLDALNEGATGTASRLLIGALRRYNLTQDERRKLLDTVTKLAEKRVRTIISNQHKRAFGRAAQLCLACADAYRIFGAPREAEAFIEAITEEFRRHTTFREAIEQACRLTQ